MGRGEFLPQTIKSHSNRYIWGTEESYMRDYGPRINFNFTKFQRCNCQVVCLLVGFVVVCLFVFNENLLSLEKIKFKKKKAKHLLQEGVLVPFSDLKAELGILQNNCFFSLGSSVLFLKKITTFKSSKERKTV